MRILQNVNLQVMKGEMVAIMGPSGSGGHVKIRLS